jgi:hypothetical protein
MKFNFQWTKCWRIKLEKTIDLKKTKKHYLIETFRLEFSEQAKT